MIKKQNYLKHAIVLFLLLLLMQPERVLAAYETLSSAASPIMMDLRTVRWVPSSRTPEATSGSVPIRDCAALTASV